MKDVSWEVALATAERLAPLRDHYVETQRHKDVASQLNILLANQIMARKQFKTDRKMGLLIVGDTGAGKTTLLKRLVRDHPHLQPKSELHQPLVQLRITAPVTNKSLGFQTLNALGFETNFEASMPAHKYWSWVHFHAEKRDAYGFLFDEGQDLFLKTTNEQSLETLSIMKGLMEVPDRPYVVILSGGPALEKFIEKEPMVSERFLRAVLRPVSIDQGYPALVKEMQTLAEMAGVKFGDDIDEIAKRTIHASFNQFGRSLELVVDGIQEAIFAASGAVTVQMFADAYHRHTNSGTARNIYLAADDRWRLLSPIKVTKEVERADTKTSQRTTEKREDTIW